MLILRNITKIYRSKRGGECRALNNVSLSFPDKGLIFVCGKSGSGKSTLLNIASGMDSANEGEIVVDGKSTKDFKQSDFDAYRNTYAGYIFQDFGLIDELNIKENISLGLELRGDVPSQEKIEDALKQVDLEGYGSHMPFELSGGQRQRVSIARALIKDPKIVFADEPTGSLDEGTGKQIFELFKKLSLSRLVVIISHDQDNAVYYGDRVITLSDGLIASDLTKTEDVDIDAARAEYLKKIDKAFRPTSDEPEVEAENFKRTKTGFPFLRAALIGISNFKAKKIRFIFMCLLSVIALTAFCLADTMRNYTPRTAAVNTFGKLGIDTLLLINNRQEINGDGGEEAVPIEFSDGVIDNIAQNYAEPFKGYGYPIKLTAYREIPREEMPPSNAFKNEIGMLVEVAGGFSEETLKGFYGSSLKMGRYPKKSKNAVEILISDFLADGIMFFGAKFDSGEVVPNTGYGKILNAYFDYGGITFKIVGIFNTDYKSTVGNKERSFEYKFNYANIYSAALTVKGALYDGAKANIIIPASAFIGSDGGDISLNLNVIGVRSAAEVLSAVKADFPIVYKKGYSDTTPLNDNEIIVGKSFLDNLLEENVYTFDELKPEDFENAVFSLKITDASREPSFTELKIVGVYDYAAEYALSGAVLTNLNTKNKFLKESLVVTNAYLPLLGGKADNENMLKYLDGEGVAYVTYATGELEAMNMLFKLLSQILGGVSAILFIFVLLLLFNFISSSVTSKQKEIGILRAMGARGIDAAKIFVIEGAALFVISAVMSVVLSFIGVAVLNSQLTKMFVNTISVLSLTPLTFVIAAIGNAFTVIIASVIPLAGIIKMKPIDAVKTKGD
ncbi:MAG: ABC transporter ATP-binding protein/permease [Clostridiales bacterium]|jgi:ABC-type lipoprotein export system ATPase subunit/ABC-type lipoprotein release transport system permease subunit|nr:ABC transporter ATP-binding protein/permease [Clostridiales bacterium]